MVVSLIIRALQSPAKPDNRHVNASGPNLHMVIVISLITLLLTLCSILLFPEAGAVIAQYNQF